MKNVDVLCQSIMQKCACKITGCDQTRKFCKCVINKRLCSVLWKCVGCNNVKTVQPENEDLHPVIPHSLHCRPGRHRQAEILKKFIQTMQCFQRSPSHLTMKVLWKTIFIFDCLYTLSEPYSKPLLQIGQRWLRGFEYLLDSSSYTQNECFR